MRWLVRLVATSDGSQPDDHYAAGIVVDKADPRISAFRLIAEANARWGTVPLPNEVYSVEPLRDVQHFKVGDHAAIPCDPPKRRAWCDQCSGSPAGTRWLCPNAADHEIIS